MNLKHLTFYYCPFFEKHFLFVKNKENNNEDEGAISENTILSEVLSLSNIIPALAKECLEEYIANAPEFLRKALDLTSGKNQITEHPLKTEILDKVTKNADIYLKMISPSFLIP